MITIPEPCKSNTPRDELVLEYIDNFRRQFVQLYPARPKLFLHPHNEHGSEVCNSLLYIVRHILNDIIIPFENMILFNQHHNNTYDCKQKFATTFIKPTKLPYKDIYDYQDAAKFIADHLLYLFYSFCF